MLQIMVSGETEHGFRKRFLMLTDNKEEWCDDAKEYCPVHIERGQHDVVTIEIDLGQGFPKEAAILRIMVKQFPD